MTKFLALHYIFNFDRLKPYLGKFILCVRVPLHTFNNSEVSLQQTSRRHVSRKRSATLATFDRGAWPTDCACMSSDKNTNAECLYRQTGVTVASRSLTQTHAHLLIDRDDGYRGGGRRWRLVDSHDSSSSNTASLKQPALIPHYIACLQEHDMRQPIWTFLILQIATHFRFSFYAASNVTQDRDCSPDGATMRPSLHYYSRCSVSPCT